MSQTAPTVVGRRYQLEHVVGRGGYGVVFRALDRQTGQPVAVKVLSGGTVQDPQRVERMVREQQAMVALTGTSAVAAVDLCRADGGALCLVMEWLEGVDLEQRLAGLEQQGTRMGIEELFGILGPVVDTLERAHEIGLVHRDIKPANVFLVAPPRRGVRLLDFGLSRMKSSATLTAAGTIMGSPSYIPPETWRGLSKLIDHRADLYSLGVIAFRALSGRLPFAADSLAELFGLVTTAPRPSLCALRRDLPPGVDVWVQHALAVSPDERFDSARDWYDSLIAVVRGIRSPAVATRSQLPQRRETEEKNVLAAAWRAAASVLKRFTDQLHLPGERVGAQGFAERNTAPGAPPAGEGAPQQLQPEPAQAVEPQPAPLGLAGSVADSPAAEDEGDRRSLVTRMLAATELRPGASPEAGPDEDIASWLGAAKPVPPPVRRRSSPTLIRFRERLASALAEAGPDDEPPPAETQAEAPAAPPETGAEPPPAAGAETPPQLPEEAGPGQAEPESTPAPPLAAAAKPEAAFAKRTRQGRGKKAKAKKKATQAKKKAPKAAGKARKKTKKPAAKRARQVATRKTRSAAAARSKPKRKRAKKAARPKAGKPTRARAKSTRKRTAKRGAAGKR